MPRDDANESEHHKTNKTNNNNNNNNNNNDETKQEEQTTSTASSSREQGEFINTGLQQWEEARAHWLSCSKSDTDSTARAAVPLDVDEIIDVIFSPRWRNPTTAAAMAGVEGGGDDQELQPRRFPQNVPLPQMVDVLVDLWEAEGLDT